MVRTWFEEGYQGLLALINHLGLIALVLVLAPTLVWSQAESSNDFSDTSVTAESAPRLETYLAQAALESPELKAAYYEWQAALEKSGYVGALPDPVISVTLSKMLKRESDHSNSGLASNNRSPGSVPLELRNRLRQNQPAPHSGNIRLKSSACSIRSKRLITITTIWAGTSP